MDNHHPSICTEAVLQIKHRNLSAVLWSTPFLTIAPEVLVVLFASLVTLSFSVFLPKNEKLRWQNNCWGFQESFLKAEGLAWRMAGCFGVLVPHVEECWLFQFALDSLLFLSKYIPDLKFSMTGEAKFRQALLIGKYILVMYHFLSQLVPHILSWFHHSSVLTAPHRSEIICLI